MVVSPCVPPPAASPIAIIGETAVNVTPCSSGSRTPIRPIPTDCRIEAMPQVNRSALIRWMSWRSSSPMALASRIGTTTAPA